MRLETHHDWQIPDALRGVITAEEAADIPAEPREVPNLAAAAAPASAAASATLPDPPAAAAPGNDNDATAGAASTATDTDPAAGWRAMAWPIRSRDGTCHDLADPDLWEAEFAARIRTIEQHPKFDAATRAETIRAVLAANRELLDWLRDERGQGAAVESVEGLFSEALGAEAATA